MDNIFGIHAQALSLRAQRAEILASNLANANTPGFQARDIDFDATLRGLMNPENDQVQVGMNINLTQTDADHMQPLVGTANSSLDLMYRLPQQVSVDGNTVETQIEHSEFLDNAIRYQTSLTILGGRIRSILSALRGE
jgi:flagellar basal-body rod protein FlgB